MGVQDCVLVLDGLDECAGMASTDSRSVPHFLQELSKAVSDTSTRILISSRGDPIIQQGLSEFSGYSEYTISPEDVGPDLMTYSSELVRSKLQNKDEMTRTSIAKRMRDRCQGQFQWIKLQEGSLRKGRSRKQLEREIDETPSGLNSLYDREWHRINAMEDSDKERALSLLRWTAFALRPLTVNEITEAVLITEETEELPADEMPDCIDQDYVETMILDLCGSLIEVGHASSPDDTNSQDLNEDYVGLKQVNLSHFSVKEYLLSRSLPGSTGLLSNEKLRAANEKLHNLNLAKLCVRFISLPGAWENWHFIDYASDMWVDHCRSVHPLDSDLQDAVNALLDGRNQNWIFIRKHIEVSISNEPFLEGGPISPFMFAVAFGLNDAVAHLINEDKYDINDRSFCNIPPLSVACSAQNKDLVRLLLENGAEVDAMGYEGVPLRFSVEQGDTGLMELLLEKGADVSAPDDLGQKPLFRASLRGNLKASQLLLDRGADISTSTPAGLTPFSAAFNRGYRKLAKLLIERGADVNITVMGRTPLHSSIAWGHWELTQVLLEHGARMDTKDSCERMALHYACKTGHLQVVQSMIGLLQASPETIDDRDHWGSTALSIAARGGHVHVVRALLDTQAVDVWSSDEFGRTAVWWATNQGHDQVVSLLTGGDPEVDECIKGPKEEKEYYCDVCLLSISGSYLYHCGICDGGDFDVCGDCVSLGAHCFSEAHELVRVEKAVDI